MHEATLAITQLRISTLPRLTNRVWLAEQELVLTAVKTSQRILCLTRGSDKARVTRRDKFKMSRVGSGVGHHLDFEAWISDSVRVWQQY